MQQRFGVSRNASGVVFFPGAALRPRCPVRTFAVIAPVATVAVLLACAAPLFAEAGTLDSPGVAFSADYPKDAQEQVMAALTRKDCKFLGGQFVNWFTSLRYGGDTKALNLFMGGLVKCPGATVHVSFKKLDDDCDWGVSHNALDNRFQIEVNLNSKQIQLEDLYIPETNGPMLKKK
jgi:hypothetical protein